LFEPREQTEIPTSEPKKIQDQENPEDSTAEQPKTNTNHEQQPQEEKAAAVPAPIDHPEEKAPRTIVESSTPEQITSINHTPEEPSSQQQSNNTEDPSKKPADERETKHPKPIEAPAADVPSADILNLPEDRNSREVCSNPPPEAVPINSNKEPESQQQAGIKQFPILNAQTLRKLFKDEGRPDPTQKPLEEKPKTLVAPISIPTQPAGNKPSDRPTESNGPDSQRNKIPKGFTYGGPMKIGMSPMTEPGSIVNPTAVRDGQVVPIDQVSTQLSPRINIIPGPTQFPTNLEGQFAIVLDQRQAEKYFDWKKTSPNGEFQAFMDSLRKGPLNKENLRSPRSSRFLDLRGSNTSAPGTLGGQGSGMKQIARDRIEPQTLNISFNQNKPGDLNSMNASQPLSNPTQQTAPIYRGSLHSIPVQAGAPMPNSLNLPLQAIPFLPSIQEPRELNKKTVILPRPEMKPDPNQPPKESSPSIDASTALINNRPLQDQQTSSSGIAGQSSNPFDLLGPYQIKQNEVPGFNPVTPAPQNYESYGSPGIVPFAGSQISPAGYSSFPASFNPINQYPTPFDHSVSQYPVQPNPTIQGYQQFSPNYFSLANQSGNPAFNQHLPPPSQNVFQLLGSG